MKKKDNLKLKNEHTDKRRRSWTDIFSRRSSKNDEISVDIGKGDRSKSSQCSPGSKSENLHQTGQGSFDADSKNTMCTSVLLVPGQHSDDEDDTNLAIPTTHKRKSSFSLDLKNKFHVGGRRSKSVEKTSAKAVEVEKQTLQVDQVGRKKLERGCNVQTPRLETIRSCEAQKSIELTPGDQDMLRRLSAY